MASDWKSWLTSRLVGGIVGVFAGGLTVLLAEAAGHALLGTADPDDLASITGPMFASVLVAWILGSWVGGAVATTWSRSRSLVPGIVVGVILLAGAASNMVIIPHPLWMMIGAVVLMPAAAFGASRWRMRVARS